jgi:hypothetical protein
VLVGKAEWGEWPVAALPGYEWGAPPWPKSAEVDGVKTEPPPDSTFKTFVWKTGVSSSPTG